MTSTEIKTHNEYTVGWVCALPKEQTAATAMLDQRHGDLPKPANDSNTYTLGSIGKHNVVIACLPKGHIGNNPAATVAAQMVSTFPSIRFGLMVGIGGGIPPKVRLGDVVVSTPVGSFSGVVQWDRGKAKDGGFERTGSLNNPPASLLTALTKLETEHELVGSKIPEYLNQLKQNWPRLAAKYLRSDSLEDILFKADYSHVYQNTTEDHVSSGSSYESEEEESCQHCDKTKVLKRKPRNMRVHYGLIASGNQVIKSAALRDQLNKDLGGNLLCVEMEAAGLMNSFPCIVIRGICDYADSHKNKDWQEYAAAVAAAFAKELLNYVQPSDVDSERTAKDVLDEVLISVAATKTDVSYIKSRLDSDEDLQILEWITSTDYGPQQSDFFGKRQPGTGQWLLDSIEYQTWLSARKQTLFCPGIPGAGKTILTSIVVDHLERTHKADSTIGIAYIYCNYRRQEEQSIENLLASLLKQLGRRQNCLRNFLKDFYEQHIGKGTRPSVDEISTVLHSVAEGYSTVFIIVDALDECQNSDGSRQRFLTELFNLQELYGWNLFLTSRVIPDIVDHCSETSIPLEIRASTEDIDRYLKENTGRLPSFVQQNQQIQKEIVEEISQAVDGMFLLAHIYLNSLNDKMTPKAIKNALRSFHKPVSGLGETKMAGILDHAYEQAMLRINEQQAGYKDLANKVLLWIVCAKRRLTIMELRHALAVEVDGQELDKENIPTIQDMVSVCAGLVTIDDESDIIRLVHYTTQEYFDQTRQRWFPDAEMVMADTCATYLLLNAFESGPCRGSDNYFKRLKSYPFYKYAAQNWGHHARKASKLCQKVMEFLQSEKKMNASIQTSRVDRYGSEEWDASGQPVYNMTGLHLAAYFGITESVKALLEEARDVDAKDDDGLTPLSWSARNGYDDVVKLLLAVPSVNVNSRGVFLGDTPLSLAARNGHEAVVKLLLAMPSIDVNSKDPWHGTPLFGAACNGHDAVVQLLLSAGADPNLGDGNRTPLSQAAEEGHEAVVRLLLNMPATKIYINSKTHDMLLHKAVYRRHVAVVKLLLAAGAEPDLVDGIGTAPLMFAAEKGDTSLVEILLAAGANPDLRDKRGSTSLLSAVHLGHVAVVNLLLASGADMNFSHEGWSALHLAAYNGHGEVVELLLAYSADPDVRDHDGTTPLLHAAYKGYKSIVKLLLEAGANPDLRNKKGQTLLTMAQKGGHEAVVELFALVDLVEVARQRAERQRVAEERIEKQEIARHRIEKQKVARERAARQRAARLRANGQEPFRQDTRGAVFVESSVGTLEVYL
ncbi:ankyrin repeat-containing domain protein [Trichoderma sp. SZMC 28015]